MSDNSKQPNRAIGVLVFLFVLLFGAILFVRYSPWSTPEFPNLATPQTQETDDDAVLEADMPVLLLQLESGPVRILLRPDLAPNHVARLIELSEQGFYDGVVFHRVIEGFMAQTGDPTGTGTGGSDLPDLAAEINDRSFVRGTLGMARAQSMNSANSQFFIVYDDASFLDGQYTLFGRVIEGMDLVDEITKGSQANGVVSNPDHIVTMRLE